MRFSKPNTVTLWLITINTAAYLIAVLYLLFNPEAFKLIALTPKFILEGKYLWTIVTSIFMHSPLAPFHLIANMISLMFLGSFLERIIGKTRFLAVYFAAGIVGGLIFVAEGIITGQTDIPAVGASGAIFGLAGMLAILTPRVPVYIMFIPIAMPLWAGVLILMFGLWVISAAANLPIGNTAHLGGLLVGVGYAIYLRLRYQRQTRLISRVFR